MTETTTETTSLDFELVAQAARLAAPVSNGPARNRRVLPVPPPPPSVWAAASAPQPLAHPARTPAPSDVADLLAWEEAAEQLEPDWATPVDDEDVAEHTAPLLADVADAGTSEAIAIVEANIAAAPSTSANSDVPADKSETDTAAPESEDAPEAPRTEASASIEAESELEALARAVTKSALDTLAARGPAPGRPLPAPPTASRAPVPPPPPAAASRPSSPLFALAASRTPLPAPANTRPISPPLSPPASRPLPPLAPAPSRPPASSAFRSPPLPPPAPSRAPLSPPVAAPRAQLPTLPRMADLEPRPELAAPSLLEIRNSPVARRFYAQLGVAAVFGALLATILFALVPRQTSVSVTPSQPATTAEAKPAPVVVAKTQEAPATADTIPPPPVANVSVDDLDREPAAAAHARPKTATASTAAAVPAALTEPTRAAAAKPETAASAVTATKGTLHINAVPAANVAIDGRPLGMTPKIVRLSPGAHRVALIGPGGRRSQTVNVAAGQSATVSVKF